MTYTCIYNYILYIYIIVAYSPPSMVVFKLKIIVSKPGAWVAGGGSGKQTNSEEKVCFWRKSKRFKMF